MQPRVDSPDVKPTRSASRAITGVVFVVLGCVLALYGSIRLGIGRHGDAWWRPFENALTRAHLENLAIFVAGLATIANGAWFVLSARRRRRR